MLRLRPNYVNSFNFLNYFIILESLHSGGVFKFDQVISLRKGLSTVASSANLAFYN